MSSLYELRNISQQYEGREVLNIEYLSLEENKIIGFFGPNGSGKSTLFSLLSFIDKPTYGNILFNGINDKRIDAKLKQSIVIVPQNPYLLKRSVFENVVYGLKLRKETENLEAKALEALSLVGLDNNFLHRKWSQLSGGEAQRVAIAARLILKPRVLILDEPTTGIDTNSAQLIKEAILLAKQKYNTTILISSHDHNWLNNICDSKVALFQGKLIESGSMNLLFAPWNFDEHGNITKIFSDNQKLTIPNSFENQSNSVLMIDSKDITICRHNCEDIIDDNTLKGIIRSISQIHSTNELLIDFCVAEVSFNCRISKDYMYEQKLLPGDEVNVNIDLKNPSFI